LNNGKDWNNGKGLNNVAPAAVRSLSCGSCGIVLWLVFEVGIGWPSATLQDGGKGYVSIYSMLATPLYGVTATRSVGR